MKKAIEIHQLSVNYDKTSTLWDINVSIPEGSLVGIIGPNGAGKSTLLKALLGFVKPLTGKATFFGLPFQKVKSRIAYVPQKGKIDWEFPITVFDVVLMGRYPKLKGLKWYRKADKEAAWKMLARLEMESLADRQISELSGGQQQRLFIARALLQEGDILLLDEPVTGLDPAAASDMYQLISRLNREDNVTVIMVSHDVKEAVPYASHILHLGHKQLFFGTSESYRENELGRRFLA